MFDWVGWLVKANSMVSYIIGLSNFECDWNSGLVFKSQRRTFYAILINILTVLLIAYMISGQMNLDVLLGNPNKLHQFAIIVMIGLRTVAGIYRRNIHKFRKMSFLYRTFNAVQPMVPTTANDALGQNGDSCLCG